jgi:hypothetical protein
MKMRFVLFGAVLASGCQPTQVPAVAVSEATVDRAIGEATADDRAVMSAVLDGALRAERDRSIRAGRATPADADVPDLNSMASTSTQCGDDAGVL